MDSPSLNMLKPSDLNSSVLCAFQDDVIFRSDLICGFHLMKSARIFHIHDSLYTAGLVALMELDNSYQKFSERTT